MPIFAAAGLIPALIGGGVAAAGSLGGAAIGASAAGNAAQTQSDAAKFAALLQQQDANAALGYGEQQLNLAQQNSAPYRRAGQNAMISLNDLMGLSSFNPYPINSGGNTAPQAGGINSPAIPGKLAAPTAMPGPAQQPNPLIPRAKGGPTKVGLHYLVGERGPEELVMHGDGTGHILPHPVHSDLIPREFGGEVRPVIPDTPDRGSGGSRPPVTPPTSTGARPANVIPQHYAPAPQVNASNNPLITGGNVPGSTSQLNPFQSWVMPFQAPTGAQAAQYPGYQFQLEQGENAINNQATATGQFGSPNTGRALVNYAEGAAQSDYGNVYNQALQQYQQAYNIFNNNQSNQFNRLADIAGLGQTSTNQLNSLGGQSAGNMGNILLGSGGQIGQQLNNAGAATASGYVGGANAWGGALGNIGNNLGQYLTLQQVLGQQGGGFDPNNPPAV